MEKDLSEILFLGLVGFVFFLQKKKKKQKKKKSVV